MNKLITTSELKKALSIGKNTLIRLRHEGKLLEGVHYVRIPGGRKFLWRLELVMDFMVTGGGVEHDYAINAYLQSLPSNQPKKIGRKKSA